MKPRFTDEQIIGMIKEYEACVKAQHLPCDGFRYHHGRPLDELGIRI